VRGSACCSLLVALGLAGPAAGAEFFEGSGFYLGDLHSHTGASGDGGSSDIGDCVGECGSYEDVAGHAAEFGLDFVSYTDHVNAGVAASPDQFGLVIEAIFDAHDPDSGLVTIPAAELIFDIDDDLVGHKNLFLFADNEDLDGLGIEDTRYNGGASEIADCSSIWAWMETVQAAWGDVLLLAHHPALGGGMATDWSCHQDSGAAEFSPAAEIYSEHGDSSSATTD
jgi:hypothetical protein